jgi:hypothetical protein
MFIRTPQDSLPQRTWIAKFTPSTLQTYLTTPNPSTSPLRRANTVWSDDFDNIIGPLSPSENSNDQNPRSRKQICRSKRTALQFDHNAPQSQYESSNRLVHGPRPFNQLFADECFVDGLVEGFGIMVVAVVFLGAIALLVWLLGMSMRSCRSTRCFRRSSRARRPLLEDDLEGLDGKLEVVVCVEEGRGDLKPWTWIPAAEAEGVCGNVSL